MTEDGQELFGVAGLCGAGAIVSGIVGAMHPAYSPSSSFVSELVYGPDGEHLSRGFLVGGLLAMLFFAGVCWGTRGRFRAAAALAMVAALGLFLVGLFPLPSIHPHNASAALAAGAALAATVVLRQAVRRRSVAPFVRRALDAVVAIEIACMAAAPSYVLVRCAGRQGSFEEIVEQLPHLLDMSYGQWVVNPVAMLEWLLFATLVGFLGAVSMAWLRGRGGHVVLEDAHASHPGPAAHARGM